MRFTTKIGGTQKSPCKGSKEWKTRCVLGQLTIQGIINVKENTGGGKQVEGRQLKWRDEGTYVPGLRGFSLNTIGLQMPLKLLNPGSDNKTHPFRASGQVMKALGFQRIL